MISVCMAVYNGEKYLFVQLDSILSQLKENNEVVIVDDASVDNSREVITTLADDRIRMLCNGQNQGVLKSFETALREAKIYLLLWMRLFREINYERACILKD